jgi:REP element-mobilizing transposase RayT
MARKPRIEFEGALYHVITRGNQKQRIFRGTEDYERYLKILGDYKTRYDFALYAYVLMGSHVHLLMETKAVPLSRILQGINQSYTMYFNRRHTTVGHLFQGRYKAILCDQDSYLISLVKYIHMNPIRARVANEGWRDS